MTLQNDSCFPFSDNTWAIHIVPQMVAHSVLHLSFYHCQHDTVWWDSSVGAHVFMGANNGPSPIMPFELEVVFCLEVWHHFSHGKNYKEMHWIHAHILISCPLP